MFHGYVRDWRKNAGTEGAVRDLAVDYTNGSDPANLGSGMFRQSVRDSDLLAYPGRYQARSRVVAGDPGSMTGDLAAVDVQDDSKGIGAHGWLGLEKKWAAEAQRTQR